MTRLGTLCISALLTAFALPGSGLAERPQGASTLPVLATPDLLWRIDGIELEASIAANASVAFSPSGAHLAVSSPSSIRVLDTADGRVLNTLRAETPQRLSYSLAIANTGRVSIGRPGSREVHEVGSELPIVIFPCDGPGCIPVSLAFSPDDTVLAFHEIEPRSASADPLGSVVVVDLVFGATTEMSASRGLAKTAFAAHPSDGHTATDSAAFELWRTDDQRLPRSLRGRGWTVGSVSRDARAQRSGTVAVYGSGSTLVMRNFSDDRLVWATPLVRPVLAPPGSGATLSRVAHLELAPNGRFVVSYEVPITTDRDAAAAGVLVVRRALDGAIVTTHDIRGVADLAIAPDSGSIAYTTATATPETALVRVPTL